MEFDRFTLLINGIHDGKTDDNDICVSHIEHARTDYHKCIVDVFWIRVMNIVENRRLQYEADLIKEKERAKAHMTLHEQKIAKEVEKFELETLRRLKLKYEGSGNGQ